MPTHLLTLYKLCANLQLLSWGGREQRVKMKFSEVTLIVVFLLSQVLAKPFVDQADKFMVIKGSGTPRFIVMGDLQMDFSLFCYQLILNLKNQNVGS